MDMDMGTTPPDAAADAGTTPSPTAPAPGRLSISPAPVVNNEAVGTVLVGLYLDSNALGLRSSIAITAASRAAVLSG
eukprot:CAMPEP_0175002304 /NCGR_PEP_ID=MMETSP0005-20121125/3610_1 /TAXON_ID=420556 /ORGANISM="Ochromonas sp., Strain CCMP1393" /LENGTH=76 /DNA_ID=CAMNT_0016257277 /DNA_START=340 /DNA_END=570 /DNA_ORIENTATION=-